MTPQSGRKSPMCVAARMLDFPRLAAAELVADQQAVVGSRMVAYQRAASSLGVSPEWLRKFVTGHSGAKEPKWSIGCRIAEQYERRARAAAPRPAATRPRRKRRARRRSGEQEDGEWRSPPRKRLAARSSRWRAPDGAGNARLGRLVGGG